MNDNSESAALAKAMREIGPLCCRSVLSMNDVLRQAGYDNSRTPGEQDIARALGMMVSRQTKSGSDNAWDFRVFANVLNKNSVDWVKVIHALDYPDFKLTDAGGFEFIINAFRIAEKVCDTVVSWLLTAVMTILVIEYAIPLHSIHFDAIEWATLPFGCFLGTVE